MRFSYPPGPVAGLTPQSLSVLSTESAQEWNSPQSDLDHKILKGISLESKK